MQNAVIRFAESRENGLCLIDMPTGSGKTYQARQLIRRYLDGEILKNVPVIIYLTPLKKNIEDIYKELREDFRGNEVFFDSNVLRIYANYESVIDSFLRLDEQIPKSLKVKESYELLKGKIEQYQRLADIPNVPSEVINTTITELRKDYEPRFRRDLEEEISSKAKGIKLKKELLNHEYAWVKEMYPACLSFDRKVLFMTMDKFISGNDPIIAKPYRFLTHSQIKGALVFIDEFDATKDVVLNQEIQNCTDYKLDLARLFSGIATALKGQEFPSQLFEGSDDQNNPKSSRASFEKMKQKILEIEDQYCLNYLFKLDSADDSDRVFLFDDYQIHTVTSTKESGKISSQTDTQKNQNIIYLDDKYDDQGAFYKSIYGMKSALNYFINCCAMMSRNYLNHYNEVAREKGLDLMEIEQAVSTIIDPYNLDRGVAETLSRMIVDNVTIPFVNRQKDIISTDFYMDGFRYYDFKDDISHDASTSFLMCYLNNTPEKMMISLASKALVVGLSATASIQTVTGNYNIDYLEERLGEQFYHLPEEDIHNIRREVHNRLNGKYEICVKSIESIGTDPSGIAKALFDSAENVERFTGLFERYINPKDKNNYQLARFAKMIFAIKEFIVNPHSKVLLSLTNKNIKTIISNDIFTEENVKQLLDAICDELKTTVPRIHHLYGSDFEKEREAYTREVRQGERIILFSSYPSVGTGQNLQYEENEGESSVEKDIDSLYIEEPTNIIVNAASLEKESDLMKYTYQMETLAKNGEINLHSAMKNIKAAFKKFNGLSAFSQFSDFNLPYLTDSKNNHALKIIIQAVGRICRTKNDRKAHTVSLYVDSNIFNRIDFSKMKNRLMNREFARIVATANDYPKERGDNDQEAIYKLNKANYNNILVAGRIDRILFDNKESWSEKAIQQWELIRKVVLKYPTISHSKLDEIIRVTGIHHLRSLYLEAKSGSVISNYIFHPYGLDDNEDDKDNQEKRFPISYYSYSKPLRNGSFYINAENSRLTALMRIPELRLAFQKRGFATDFLPDEMIILPVVYQNIYKGALGEEAGRILLSQIGVSLQPITDPRKYEKFDYQLADNEDVYVDFKNWSEEKIENRKGDLEECERKLQLVGGRKVFVINMVSSDFAIHERGRIVEISSMCRPVDGGYLYRYKDSEYTRIFKKFSEVMDNGNH